MLGLWGIAGADGSAAAAVATGAAAEESEDMPEVIVSFCSPTSRRNPQSSLTHLSKCRLRRLVPKALAAMPSHAAQTPKYAYRACIHERSLSGCSADARVDIVAAGGGDVCATMMKDGIVLFCSHSRKGWCRANRGWWLRGSLAYSDN